MLVCRSDGRRGWRWKESVFIVETALVVLLDEVSLDVLKWVLDVFREFTFECLIREDGRERIEHVCVSVGVILVCAEEGEVTQESQVPKEIEFLLHGHLLPECVALFCLCSDVTREGEEALLEREGEMGIHG